MAKVTLDGENRISQVVHQAMQQEKEREKEERLNAKQNARYKAILDTLAELGGRVFNDDEILFEGDKLIVPKNMSLTQAKEFLQRKEEEMERVTQFTRTFNYRPWDGAYCAWNFMKRTFGVVGHKDRTVRTIFGEKSEPPALMDIKVGVDQSEPVPWGNFNLPFLPGCVFTTDTYPDNTRGPLFYMSVEGPKKYRFEIEGIFNGIQAELEQNSLYRGKAFDGQVMPDFIDLSVVDRAKVVYSEEVMAQLEANVWAQLRHTDECERQGIPLKRAVLIHGPFGTGKTLAALLTGQEAVAAGWTYIKARPGRDNIFTVLQTAKLYEPCVVFYEDVDQIADADETDRQGIAQLLDTFDGIEAKSTRILCVLTTNYPEKIHKGMARPGRLDAMIEINDLDQAGVEALVRTRLDEDTLEEEIDWAAVFAAADGYKPAFVTEFADRTIRYLIARHGAVEGHRVGTRELVNAAHGLRPQYERMIGAKEQMERDPIGENLRVIVKETVRENLAADLLRDERS